MNIESVNLQFGSTTTNFSSADTKESVKEKLGEPDDIGGHFGKRKIPLIYKYESIEFHFDTDRTLFLIYKDNEFGPEVSIIFNKTF